MTFQVGDVVVCVDASPCKCCGLPIPIRAQALYRVASVLPGFNVPLQRSAIGLTFYGVDLSSKKHPGWRGVNSERFRPVTKASEQFTASIRAGRPAHSPAPVA